MSSVLSHYGVMMTENTGIVAHRANIGVGRTSVCGEASPYSTLASFSC